MRKLIPLESGWRISGPDGIGRACDLPFCTDIAVNVPLRAVCRFPSPELSDDEQLWLEVGGAGVHASVTLNGHSVMDHDGANTLFRCEVTHSLRGDNELIITLTAGSGASSRLFLRDVRLLIVNRFHFDLSFHGGCGLAVCPDVEGKEKNADIWVRSWHNAGDEGRVHVSLLDADGEPVAEDDGTELDLIINKAHRWKGSADPYLYTCRAELIVNENVVDEVSTLFGVRSFRVEPQKGFFLNNRSYPLRGVCRYQDHPETGLALTREQQEADIRLLREMGATAVRLMGRPHDPIFLDLCDRYGIVVLTDFFCPAGIPTAAEDVLSLHTQMQEAIVQQYNHPSVCIWGVSSDINASKAPERALSEVFESLISCIRDLDPSRPTSFTCGAGDSPFDKLTAAADLVSRTLYHGARKGSLSGSDLWLKLFHMLNSKRCLGLGEYGCDGRVSLQSAAPAMGDGTEGYQAQYHEYMLRCRDNHSFLWGTFLSSLCDLAPDDAPSDSLPALHQGLITADRETRKDAFYLYKAHWSKEPFVHICGKSCQVRPGKISLIRVYSNSPDITLFVNGKEYGRQVSNRIFLFRVPISGEMRVEAVAGYYRDEAVFRAE